MSSVLSLLVRRATMMRTQAGGLLPAGYTQYDWVETADTSSDSKIDTGLAPNGATWRFDGMFARTQNFGYNYTMYGVFGRKDIANNSYNYGIFRGAKNYNKIVFNYASVLDIERSCGFSSETISIGVWYDFSLHNTEGVNRGGTLTIGESTDQFTASGTYSSDGHLFVFTGYLCRFGRFKIYDSDVLVADLVPAQRNSDGAVGFYDVVRSMFLTSSGENPLLTCGNGLEDFTV